MFRGDLKPNLRSFKRNNILFYFSFKSTAELFLSERNLVIITFENAGEHTAESVFKRLLRVANKNILPNSILILGLHLIEAHLVNKIVNEVTNLLNRLIAELEELLKQKFTFIIVLYKLKKL